MASFVVVRGMSRSDLRQKIHKCEEDDSEFGIIDLESDTETGDMTRDELDKMMAEAAPSELEALFSAMGVNNLFSVSLFAVAIAIIIANNVLGYGWAREYIGGEGNQGGETVRIERGLFE